MRVFLALAGFEIRTRLRRISTWVYFAVFLALATAWTAAAGGAIPGAIVAFGSGKVFINSPYAIAQTVAFLGLAGLTVIAAVLGRAVQQDFEYRVESFFFTSPIAKWQYLGGRFAGALVVLVVIFSSIAFGNLLGLALPGIDPDRIGPMRPFAYVAPYFTVLLPNIIGLGGLFFALAALTRRMLPVYIGSVVLLVSYLAAGGLLRDLEYKTAAAMLDPFGMTAAARFAEYWTIAERNERLLPFAGLILWNRLLWLGIGVLAIAFAWQRFSFAHAADAGRSRQPALPEADDSLPPAIAPGTRAADPAPVRPWRLVPALVLLYLRETVKNVYFGVIALSGVLFMTTTAATSGSIYGTTTWPVTYQMLELTGGTFSVFMLIIITFYGGELVFRERDHRLDPIHDALPVPSWLPLASKLIALMLVPVLLQAVVMLCGIGIQTAKGYHHYEIGLYLSELFGIDLLNYWLVCVLAIAVHAVVNQKYLGHFTMVVYFVAISFAGALGFEHNLYLYDSPIGYTYSDMNGYGHFLLRVRSFQTYYAAGAILLIVVAYLMWVRGTVSGWRERLVIARRRFTRPVAFATIAGACATIGTGGFIFTNTNILNHYQTTYELQARQANYEKRYKSQSADAQPKVTGVKVTVDLYPRERRVRMQGSYALANRSGRPVEVINLGFPASERLVIHKLEFAVPATLATDDMAIGVRSYRLATPLAPGATTELAFDLELPVRGFTNSGSYTDVVYNGSFVNGRAVLPTIGYQERGELLTDRDRKKFGLAPKERMRDRDDPAGLAVNYLTNDADWISFETIVGTEDDQIAIAPGYLTREWQESGRRYFEYKMDAPILDFFAYQSARYVVAKDRWNDVAIEIYHHPGHEYNVDRMIAAVKASLDYYTTNFGPYQHRQFRIMEFPRYARFAQAFPNTIPYSEAIGFIARVRDDDARDIDYPYYVTAHEAAHQWWAHQVIGGDVQGATLLSETLAQYSALMVMKKKYGEAKMQRFLAYELDRYLLGRATEQKKELPLGRVENQDYIHYRKGSLVMYALADYIGEAQLNRAIRAFRDETAYKGPPYPSATRFLQFLREATPPHLRYVIDDLFESITIYDNRAVSARATARPDGRFDVALKVIANKRKADALGKETDVAIADWIDIGVLDADNQPLFLEKRKLERAESEFTLVVDRKPARAGIDPYNKLIDRRPKDNTVAVEIARP